MKKITSLILTLIVLLGVFPSSTQAAVTHDEMRAVWIATVWNLDYPSASYVNNPEAQKKQYIELLERLEAMGFNTVVVQVRPKADAFYQSKINPWSDVLTGTQGKDPGYDPMAFMIEEAHKRGMAFHAWLNPYRIMTGGVDFNKLAENHPARLNPDWTITYNNGLYYNPALPEVQQHIADTVAEIVTNYDVDGVHFDDYFYPSGYPLPEGEDRDGPVANSRREDINKMIKKVSDTIKKINKNVDFGVSPLGIWKNKKSDPQGSNTNGGEGYYSVCADAKTWIENEWIDYIVPQIYWEIGHAKADYKTLVAWWSNLVKGTKVKLYIGQGVYKDEVASTIDKILLENTKHPEIKGNIHFSLRDILNNRMGVADKLTTYHKNTDIEIELPTESVLYKKGAIVGNNVNVRSGAGTHFSVLSKVSAPTQVDVLETTNGWHKIRLASGQIGYILNDFVKVSDAIRLVINDKQVQPPVDPILENNTTLVPLRIVSEDLGAQVEWKPESKKIIIKDGNQTITLTIGLKEVDINGKTTTLAVAPVLKNGTTMVPIRFVSENIGATVRWLQEERIVKVNR